MPPLHFFCGGFNGLARTPLFRTCGPIGHLGEPDDFYPETEQPFDED